MKEQRGLTGDPCSKKDDRFIYRKRYKIYCWFCDRQEESHRHLSACSDLTIERIGDLVSYSLPALLGAAKAERTQQEEP